MASSLKNYIYILLFVLFSSFIIWLPFIQQLSFLGFHNPHTDTQLIYRNYDGLLYLIAGKAWYSPSAIQALTVHVPIQLPPYYFPAHLPLYPATIVAFAKVLGYVKAMMFSNILFTVLLGSFFFFMVKKLSLSSKPLLLTFVMLMLPRFLVIRSIGAPESLLMLCVLVSLYFFEKKNYFLAGLAGGLAAMTKLPGILLFPAFGIPAIIQIIRTKKFDIKWLWLGLIPLGLLTVCLIYQTQTGDFFSYWHTGAVVPMPYPYSAFDVFGKWVGTHWLEDVVLYFWLFLLTPIYLYKNKHSSFFYFSLVFIIGLVFTQHRDISRLALPMWPLSCIAFEQFLTSKKPLLAFILILPAIYLYAWTFMQGNAMSVSNWAPFL